MVAAVALLALVSCNKEEINNGGVERPQAQEPSVLVEFTASLGEEPAKTTLSEGKTLWLESDEISINGQVFKVKELVDGGASAIFVNKSEIPAGFAAPYTALYPANVTEVPSTQTAYAGKFDPNAVLETATSNNEHLSFKNVTSLLKFQVPAACNSVTITSEDVLAGSNSKTVTIGGTMVAGTDYYVAVLPGTKNNFKVKMDDFVVKESPKVTIARSVIADMKTLPRNIYLHANTARYNWTSDGARFATWTWGTGVSDSWFNMVAEGHDGVYRLEVPAGYANLIFCRMSGSVTANDWKNVWNQTANITLLDQMNHFYIYKDNAGVWSDNGNGLPTINAEANHIYLQPSANWLEADAHFAAWVWTGSGAGKVYNFKQHPRVPALYEITVPAGSTGMILFRLAPNQKYSDNSTTFPNASWQKSDNLNIGSNNLYTVVNWLESSSKFSKVTSLY